MIEKGAFVAVRNPEGKFWICQSLTTIPLSSKKKKFNIVWYNTVGNGIYVKSTADSILPQTVIDKVDLIKCSRFSFKLSKKEENRILGILELVPGSKKLSKNKIKKQCSSNNVKKDCNSMSVSHENADLFNVLCDSDNTNCTINVDIESGSPKKGVDISNSDIDISCAKNLKRKDVDNILCNNNKDTNGNNSKTDTSIALVSTNDNIKKTTLRTCKADIKKDQNNFDEFNILCNSENSNSKISISLLPTNDIVTGKLSSSEESEFSGDESEYAPSNLSDSSESEDWVMDKSNSKIDKRYVLGNKQFHSNNNKTGKTTQKVFTRVNVQSENQLNEVQIVNKDDILPNITKRRHSAASDDTVIIDNTDCQPDDSLKSEGISSLKRSRQEELSSSENSDVISVQPSLKNSITGKRIYDKTHVCYFCNKRVSKMSRHLELCHSKEMEVAKILAYPIHSKERKEGFAFLMRAGDFFHNCEVLTRKSGDLILVRRPTEEEGASLSYSDYGPCPECLGFLLKKHLWHHLHVNCSYIKKEKNLKKDYVKVQSQALIAHTIGDYPEGFRLTVLNKFRTDYLSEICKKDKLIITFGLMQFEKYNVTQHELIRQSMRQLARLFFQIQSQDPSCKTFSDCLDVSRFDSLITAVKFLCVNEEQYKARPTFQIPSLALKLGHHLRKCAAIERGISLKNGNLHRDKEMKSFLNLMELEWSTRVSSNALSTLHRRVMNRTEILPLTNDIIKLNKHLDSVINICTHNLSRRIRNEDWLQLAKVTLARLIIFNKRRSGEASKLTIQDYLSQPDWKNECTEEVLMTLTPLEKKISSSLKLIYVPGKRGRKVPVLVTPFIKAAIDLLLKTRTQVDILKENNFVFAQISSENHIRGHDCIRNACKEAELQKPDAISSTRLRKYIATVSQLFNLKENECDWLARHLGHDIRVHREFYRLQESAVELAKVSHLLLAVEAGDAGKYAGKSIADIEIKDTDVLEDPETEHFSESDSETEITVPERASVTETIKKQISNKTVAKVKPWSASEKNAVLKFFRRHIKNCTVPKKEEVEACIKESGDTLDRPWRQIKYFVYNQIKKINKLKKMD